ncbi:hypothetical protein [Corynebacterium wankanglinii]|uniref:hypothetical protein n=1 Tax=Corynebacterium wankanglinii TaxID=2735136 RepID=UPI0015E624C9|nr:hypothetical protein [Corynebacterium wankanglinii]
MASIFQTAVSQALVDQPWYIRRKDSLTAAAGLVLQIANVLVAYGSDMPEWANVAIAAIIGTSQIFIHAGTPGAITPSQAAKLEVAAAEAAGDRQPVSGFVVQPGESVEIADPNEGHAPALSAFAAGRQAAHREGQAVPEGGAHRAYEAD